MKATSLRTHCCGDLRAAHVGQRVRLAGWVHSRRDHGGVYFLDLRDRSGLVQVVVNPEEVEAFLAAGKLGSEFVIQVEGLVHPRPEGMKNPKLPTGDIEVRAQTLRLLGSPALREELGQRGLELARRRYEWSALAPQLGDLYDEVLARSPKAVRCGEDVHVV